jgi:hypothetical protein
MTEDNVILQVSPGLPPFLNPTSLAEGLYPGVAVSVKTDFKNGMFSVESFIVGSSSVSIKKEGSRRVNIGLESLPGKLGEGTTLGFVVEISDSYVVEKIHSDTDVDVTAIKIRLFGPNPALQFFEGTEKS